MPYSRPEEYFVNPLSIISLNRLFSVLLIVCLLPAAVHADDRKYLRTVEKYELPDVVLVNQNGTRIQFNNLLNSTQPLIIQFTYSTCATICPLLSAGFADLQQKLEKNPRKVHLISISIDPEHDTPKVMKEFLKRYQAKPGWDFLTGSRADINSVMRAFKAYIPNKTDHIPLTFMKAPGEQQWVRIYGFMSNSEFMNEFTKVGNK
jgi:protein SCO1